MDHKVIFEGRIERREDGDNWDALHLGDIVLSEAFAEALNEERKQVSVRYYISPEPMTKEQRTNAEVTVANGEGYAEYISRYNDITGYLWTDEALTVGGHDLKTEISGYVGKWCRLELTIHE